MKRRTDWLVLVVVALLAFSLGRTLFPVYLPDTSADTFIGFWRAEAGYQKARADLMTSLLRRSVESKEEIK